MKYFFILGSLTLFSFFLIITHAMATEKEPVVRVLDSHGVGAQTFPLEKYLEGVLPNEMARSWPLEALKAQAVASRSFALYQIKKSETLGKNYDVTSSIDDQVFREGDGGSLVNRALTSTRGMVLENKGEVIEAFFHSCCGGFTESAADAELGERSPLKRGVKDSYCSRSPVHHWVYSLSGDQLASLLRNGGRKIWEVRDIKIVSKTSTHRAARLHISGKGGSCDISGVEFRKLLGTTKLKGLLFAIHHHGSYFIFEGEGYGHGVGMCQYGAKAMADKGWSYKKILNFYYPGISITKIY